MAAHKMTPGQKPNSGMQFWKLEFKKRKIPKKSRIGAEVPHPPFFLGMVWTSHPPFFQGWKPSLKKGGKKRGILLFLYRWPTMPPFFKAILQKIEGSPFFSFFLWIAFSGEVLKTLYGEWEKIRYRRSKTLRKVLRNACFGGSDLGSAEKGYPGLLRFVRICSDFPGFFRFAPICVPRFGEYPDLFRIVPICSDFFRLLPICFQNKSEQPLSADPFCKSPIVFMGKRGRKTVQKVKNVKTTAVAICYGFERGTIFSMEGSFG